MIALHFKLASRWFLPPPPTAPGRAGKPRRPVYI